MKNNQNFPFSIKKRLIASSILSVSLLILLSWTFIFYETSLEIDEVYDARLGQSSKILALSAPTLIEALNNDKTLHYDDRISDILRFASDDDSVTPYGHPYEQNILFQFYIDDKIVLKSQGAPTQFLGKEGKDGFAFTTVNQKTWRYFQLTLTKQNKTIYLIVAERQSIREELVNEIAMSTALPLLFLIPTLAIILTWLINKLLKPIDELRLSISQRSVNHLDEISVITPTLELQPLVSQLNYLLNELDNAWQRERRLTRTAAHELKTPLTVLRLNAENALNSQNKAQLDNDLNHILAGIDRTDRLIQQLLMLSRVEGQKQLQFSPVDSTLLIQEVIANLAPIALKQQQELIFESESKLFIQGEPTFLSILFNNIIDNAIRYSGQHSEIIIKQTYSPSQQTIEVEISDNGGCISDNIRENMFEKFFRGETGKGDGAGLGMSIVLDIIKSHQGKIELLPYQVNHNNTFKITLPASEANYKLGS